MQPREPVAVATGSACRDSRSFSSSSAAAVPGAGYRHDHVVPCGTGFRLSISAITSATACGSVIVSAAETWAGAPSVTWTLITEHPRGSVPGGRAGSVLGGRGGSRRGRSRRRAGPGRRAGARRRAGPGSRARALAAAGLGLGLVLRLGGLFAPAALALRLILPALLQRLGELLRVVPATGLGPSLGRPQKPPRSRRSRRSKPDVEHDSAPNRSSPTEHRTRGSEQRARPPAPRPHCATDVPPMSR